MNNTELMNAAKSAAEKSYSPYSRFAVGAALLCDNGIIYQGCNIENASYSATLCAERAAFASAISNGEKSFSAIAITGGKTLCPPCGVCRQFMSELCNEDFKIILCDEKNLWEYTLGELLPYSFNFEKMK